MIYSVQQIKYEILAHIKEFGGEFSDWYVGVADDPKDALHGRHRADENEDVWLYKQALSTQACRTVQSYFLQRLNTDGEAVAASEQDMRYIYVYKKSARTDP